MFTVTQHDVKGTDPPSCYSRNILHVCKYLLYIYIYIYIYINIITVVWRVLRCLIMLVVLKCCWWLPPRGISARHTLQMANFMSLSDTLKNVQAGELMLLATAKLRSAVECPFATHADGKSRAINLSHVIGFFDRSFWGSQIKHIKIFNQYRPINRRITSIHILAPSDILQTFYKGGGKINSQVFSGVQCTFETSFSLLAVPTKPFNFSLLHYFEIKCHTDNGHVVLHYFIRGFSQLLKCKIYIIK